MKRQMLLWSLVAAGGVVGIVVAQKAVSVTVNGKAATVETISKNGKIFVDGVAFAKALGATATLSNGTLIVSSSNATPYTQGTTQQAGGVGVIGKSYTIGREKPLNFALRVAEFQIARVVIGNEIYAPKNNEKLLLLRATVQNPQKVEANLSNYQLKFTAVDAKDVNHPYGNYVAREGSTEQLNIYLKPAQKIDVVIPIIVPASGTVPKLIVEGEERGAPVLRYNLSKSIKGLLAPYAAAKDPYSAPPSVPAQMGTYYPAKEFDFKLESATYSTEVLARDDLEANERFLMATFVARNPINDDQKRYLLGLINDLEFNVADADNNITKELDEAYKVGRPERISDYPSLVYNQESKFRIGFKVPKDLKLKSINVSGGLRDFVFDLSSLK
jgi:hypothetical protein